MFDLGDKRINTKIESKDHYKHYKTNRVKKRMSVIQPQCETKSLGNQDFLGVALMISTSYKVSIAD